MSARKIPMITSDYTKDYKAMVPFQALRASGHDALQGGSAIPDDPRVSIRSLGAGHVLAHDRCHAPRRPPVPMAIPSRREPS